MENIGGKTVEFTPAELKEFRVELEAIPTIGFRKPASVHTNL